MSGRLRFLASYLLFWLAFFLLLRAVFLVWSFDQALALPSGTLLGTFAHGFRLDLSAAAYLCVIPFLLVALSTVTRAGRWPSRLVLGYTLLAISGLTLLAAADLGVFGSWRQRIDASILPYLAHPREFWASAGALPRGLLLGLWIGLAALCAFAAWRLFAPRLKALPPSRTRDAGLVGVCAALLFIPARGGWQLIPINQSSAYFSPVRFANQAALNVGWNFFDSWRRRLDRTSNPYAVMPMDSARAILARARGDTSSSGEEDRAPPVVFTTTRPNILLIVWESLTARAVESLGGVPGVTPELDALARKGLLFRRFYAAGDHTEKGVAALLAGAPGVPNTSILRIPAKLSGLPMLSHDLAKEGYHTAFYYGGELGFGNLKGFAMEAGFERVLGKQDFPRSSWGSKWGAHDDAVAERLLDDLRRTPAPFFTTWLTLSSHEPFDVPRPVRVSGRDAESRFLNSLAFTDQVIGNLLRQAAKEPWFANTLVVIVADHSKPLPRKDVGAPFKSAESWYHIPMVWTGGALVRRGEIDAIGGQTDFAPTMLGGLGLPSGGNYRFGRDLFSPIAQPFAFYGFDDGFGLVTETGSFVWERAPNAVTSSLGVISPAELRLGQAILQVAYQDYLER